jgi:hypothetical protein
LESLPLPEKLLFHVEHTPVQILAPGSRGTCQQPKAVRSNNLQWQLLRQFGNGSDRLATDLDLSIANAVPLHPEGQPQSTLSDSSDSGGWSGRSVYGAAVRIMGN